MLYEVITICVPILGGAQEKVPNMVLNPSFEEFNECPQDYTFIVITSYSIHYTKLYEYARLSPPRCCYDYAG